MSEIERKRKNDGLIGFIKEWAPLIGAILLAVATWYQYKNMVNNLNDQVNAPMTGLGPVEHRVTIVETKMDQFLSNQIRGEKKLDWLIQNYPRK